MLQPDKKIIAIRSLYSVDHATNIPPTVLIVSWNLGKRCNYDCSYCGDLVHDAVSPFVNKSDALIAIDNLHSYAVENNKTISWGFTGGEPFIDPSFMNMLEVISSKSTTHSVVVSSNGSLPLSVYLQASQYVTNLTISIHQERSVSEIARTINTIKELNKLPSLNLSVTVMFVAGSTTNTESIIKDLTSSGVKTILRKIRPPADTHQFESLTKNKKDRVLLDVEKQKEIRLATKKTYDTKALWLRQEYYTEQEHAFAEVYYAKEKVWNNMGVWYEGDNYSEINSDEMLTHNTHTFTNWICFAGVDSLYIDFDGSVYRGNCYVDGAIGHIKSGIQFKQHPIKCNLIWCTCNTDMTVRKCSKTKYLKLIT